MVRHYPALDLIRGIAALAVVAQHAAVMAGYPRLVGHGYLAVDVFFVLSGFVIARAYEPRFDRDLGVGRFMAVRIARLYPAILLGATLGLVSLLVAVPGKWTPTPTAMLQFALVPFATDSTLAYPINDVFWTLLLELAVNLAHRLGWRRLTPPVLIGGLALAALALMFVSARFGGLNVGYDRAGFAAGFARVAYGYGAGLLCYRRHAAGKPGGRTQGPALLLILLAIYLLLPAFGHNAVRDAAFVLLLAPAILWIGLSVRLSPVLARIALVMGAVSYPLYAIHYPLLEIGGHFIRGTGAAPAAVWLPLTAAIVAAAWLVEIGYDAPLRQWLARRIDPRR